MGVQLSLFLLLCSISALPFPLQKWTNIKNLVYILSCLSSCSYIYIYIYVGGGVWVIVLHIQKNVTHFCILPFTHPARYISTMSQQYSTNVFFLMAMQYSTIEKPLFSHSYPDEHLFSFHIFTNYDPCYNKHLCSYVLKMLFLLNKFSAVGITGLKNIICTFNFKNISRLLFQKDWNTLFLLFLTFFSFCKYDAYKIC